jgi:tRNA 2-thiouridine synthesizing protein C
VSSRILFTFRHPPYGSATAREGLDALLAAAVYEQDIAVLFLNDGIFQLLRHQNAEKGHTMDHGRMVRALPIYGVDKIYVHKPSLTSRGLTKGDLLLDAVEMSNTETRDFMNAFDQILSF